jgi:alpha-mannosidase
MKDSRARKVYIVPHTHWDREWYATEEKFRLMLVELVDRIIHTLKEDPEFRCFMLDGQTIILEDYLHICPDRKEVLQQLVAQERLLVGPWYILPDEFLISGEGHIRNYLIGRHICREFGGHMNLGYLPDSFGHPSQMPQILKGLGMNEIIFWRGLGPDISKTEFIWEGFDGTEILGINMPLSYGIGACLPREQRALTERIKSIIQRLEPSSECNPLLVMQGVDHVAPPENLADMVRTINRSIPEYDFVLGNLKEYLSDVNPGNAGERTRGELRSGYKAYLLGGTISSRMYIKQMNHHVEKQLTAYAEPLSLFAHIMGRMKYPDSLLLHAWKSYLLNMPHDSICGCSIDPVHEEMLIRFRNLETINNHLIEKAANILGGLFRQPEGGDGVCLLYNPLPVERSDSVCTELLFEEELLRKVNYDTGELEEFTPEFRTDLPDNVWIMDPAGRTSYGRIVEWIEDDEMELSLDTQPRMYRSRKALVDFRVEKVPSFSISLLRYEWKYTDTRKHTVFEPLTCLENEFVKIFIPPETGTLSLKDKLTGQMYADFLGFSDTGDAGDEYTYSPPFEDREYVSQLVAFNFDNGLDLDYEISVPVSLSTDRKSRSLETDKLALRVHVNLHPGSRRLDILVKTNNRMEDHRLRMIFRTRIATHSSYADSLFAVEKRYNTGTGTNYRGWKEAPSTNLQKGFVTLADEKYSFTVFSKGLPEYQVFADQQEEALIAVTLLRCVGWLSRPDLLSRNGNGGWTIPTPGAQCKGDHTFQLAVLVGENRGLADVIRESEVFQSPLMVLPVDTCCCHGETSTVPQQSGSFSLFSLDAQGVVVTAVKKPDRGEGLIIRCANMLTVATKAMIKTCFLINKASKGDLAEEQWLDVGHEDHSVCFELRGGEIVTILLVPEGKDDL